MLAKLPLYVMTLGTFLVVELSLVMGEPKESKFRNSGHHPSIFGESAYSVNRFVLILTEKTFNISDFLFHRYNPVH